MSALGPFALALLAGVVSFTSPCCLPLMPGYLSYVGGVAGDEIGAVVVRRRVLLSASLFVLGFAMGLLMIAGRWTELFTPLIRWASTNDWPPI